MSVNNLAKNCVRYGLDMVGVRGALRDFRTDTIADGEGATVGVHDFGVFYVWKNAERYVLLDGEVYKVDERLVLKLRPEKAEPTLLDESEMVQIQFDLQGPSQTTWQFQSTSRANRFVQTLPTEWEDDDYDFVRVTVNGQRKYCLVYHDYSGDLTAGEDIQFSSSPDRYYLFRWPVGLNTNIAGGPSLSAISYNQSFKAALAGESSPLYEIDDVTYGSESKAWLRQRAIDESDR